jgi:glycosyltransferase involved in cell wall biosynthesis
VRIGIIHPALHGPGGAESTLLNSARILNERGHDVHVFVANCNPSIRSQYKFSIHALRDSLPRWLRGNWILRFAFPLKYQGLLQQMDMVICHNFPSVIWGQRALRGMTGRRPLLIWHCHEPRRDLYPDKTDAHIMKIDRLSPADLKKENATLFALQRELEMECRTPRNDRNRRWEKDSLKNFDLVWCNSHFIGGIARSIYGLPVCMSYPPVQMKPAVAAKVAKTVGVLFTPAERKNMKNALRAMARAKAQGCEAEFVIGAARPAEFSEWLRENLGDEPLLAAMEVVNTSSGEGLDRFYSRLSLMIFVPIDEPLGLLPIEAARFGVVSLLSDHGGPAEVASLGFGRTVDPFDYRKIAAAITGWSQTPWPEINPNDLSRLVKKHFDESHFVADLTALVKSAPRGSPSPQDFAAPV